MFFGPEQYYNFSDLMPEYQQRINDIIEKEKLNIDTNKLQVFYMNFMSDIDDTRYGTVRKNADELIANMYKNILKYANELGLQDTIYERNSYLFTKNLKELSGAVLYKMVFTFKLAYIIELEKN